MRRPKPPPIVLTPTQRVVLRRLARRQSGAQRLVRRARIILEAASGADNEQIANLLGIAAARCAPGGCVGLRL